MTTTGLGALIVIPARYSSTRFPGKALVDLAGKPMIVRTWERVVGDVDPDRAIVATDDDRIVAACREHGIERVEKTSTACITGTDRVAEVAERYPDVRAWVNVQGDEPLLPSGVIDAVLCGLHSAVDATCAMTRATTDEEKHSLTIPRIVTDLAGRALYMTRRSVPYSRYVDEDERIFRQVCVYAFWRKALLKFGAAERGPLERRESVELLRIMEHGGRLGMIEVPEGGISIDVPEDVPKVLAAGCQRGIWK